MAFQVPRVTSSQHRWRENTGQGCSATQPHSGHVGVMTSLTRAPKAWPGTPVPGSVGKGNGHFLPHGWLSTKLLKVAPGAGGPLSTVRNKAEAILRASSR